MLEIQRLEHHEGERLRVIRLAALRDAPDAFGSTYAETAARPAESWRQQIEALATFVAHLDGVDVGLVRGGPSSEHSSDAFLLSMWVAPRARGRRVGEALIAAVIGWARSDGYDTLVLDVGDANHAAIALYSRMGFEATGDTGCLPAPRAHIGEHRRALHI